MYINCSNCNTVFSVPDNQIPPEGKKVKCSKCGHIWHQNILLEKNEEKDSVKSNSSETLSTEADEVEISEMQIDKVKILAELKDSAATFTKKAQENANAAGSNKTYPKLNQSQILNTQPTNHKKGTNTEILITPNQNISSNSDFSNLRGPSPRLKDSVNLPILLKPESPSWFNFLSVIMMILIIVLSAVLFLVSNGKIIPRNEAAHVNLEELQMEFNPSEQNIVVYYSLHNNLDRKIESPLIMVTLLDENDNVIDYQINKLHFDTIEGRQLFTLKTIFSGQDKAANKAQIIVGTNIDFLIHGYLIQSDHMFKKLRQLYNKALKQVSL